MNQGSVDHRVTDDSVALDRGLTILLELGGPVDLLTTGVNHRDVAVKARRLQLGVRNMPRGAQPAEDQHTALSEAVTVAVSRSLTIEGTRCTSRPVRRWKPKVS
jgi:hypothetical protein